MRLPGDWPGSEYPWILDTVEEVDETIGWVLDYMAECCHPTSGAEKYLEELKYWRTVLVAEDEYHTRINEVGGSR